MPFTIAHFSIFLPFNRCKFLSITGLIFGAMAPDLEYFSRMKILATYGHLWLEGLWFNVLIGLMYCFVFHLFVRDVTIQNLPNFLRSRFYQYQNFNWIKYFKSNWLKVIFSLIIGIYSHLLWDSFTHEWGFFVQRIPFVNFNWISNPIELKGYKFLQYFSSIIGLIFIGLWILKQPKSEVNFQRFNFKFWLIVLFLSCIISWVRFTFFPVEMMTGNLIVVPMMAGFLTLVFLGILHTFKIKPQV